MGKDVVDHGKGSGSTDDYANALAGMLKQLAGTGFDPFYGEGRDQDDPDGRAAWRVACLMQHIYRYA